jgi:hypothetical protein
MALIGCSSPDSNGLALYSYDHSNATLKAGEFYVRHSGQRLDAEIPFHSLLTQQQQIRAKVYGFERIPLDCVVMQSVRGRLMSKQAAEYHHKAAEHHEHAARHHEEAAKHHEAGKHETAAHHAQLAHGHQAHATHHAAEAAKSHIEHHEKAKQAHN